MPTTTVTSSFFAGAEMMTFFAPAAMCAFALSASVKWPVDYVVGTLRLLKVVPKRRKYVGLALEDCPYVGAKRGAHEHPVPVPGVPSDHVCGRM